MICFSNQFSWTKLSGAKFYNSDFAVCWFLLIYQWFRDRFRFSIITVLSDDDIYRRGGTHLKIIQFWEKTGGQFDGKIQEIHEKLSKSGENELLCKCLRKYWHCTFFFPSFSKRKESSMLLFASQGKGKLKNNGHPLYMIPCVSSSRRITLSCTRSWSKFIYDTLCFVRAQDNAKLYTQLIDLEFQQSIVNEDEMIKHLDAALAANISAEDKVLLSRRKMEFMEDFSADVTK